MVKSIKENLKIVHERICSAAEKSGRNLNDITLGSCIKRAVAFQDRGGKSGWP